MFHLKFVNDHEPFTWHKPTLVELETRLHGWRPMGIMACRVVPYSERELVRMRRQWLMAMADEHQTPLLPYPYTPEKKGVVLALKGWLS